METGNRNKILIVDDEAYIRLLIEQTLEELEDQGVLILKTDNGDDALRLVREEQPRLIFLDVMIPKVNGFDVCRTIKRAWGMEGIKVVILTAKGQQYDRQTGDAAGADLYMTKPFDPDELLQIAVKALSEDASNFADPILP